LTAHRRGTHRLDHLPFSARPGSGPRNPPPRSGRRLPARGSVTLPPVELPRGTPREPVYALTDLPLHLTRGSSHRAKNRPATDRRLRPRAPPRMLAIPRATAIASWYCSPCRREHCWPGSTGPPCTGAQRCPTVTVEARAFGYTI